MTSTCSRTAALAVASWPATALASGIEGMWTMFALGLVVLPLTVVYLSVMPIFALRGAYRSGTTAIRHSLLASITPVFGAMVLFSETHSGYFLRDEIVLLLILAGLLALSWLPVVIHWYQRRSVRR